MRPRRLGAPGNHGAEAKLLQIGQAIRDGRELPAIQQLGRVHGMAGSAERVGKGNDAGGEALNVVEEENSGHGNSTVRIYSSNRLILTLPKWSVES